MAGSNPIKDIMQAKKFQSDMDKMLTDNKATGIAKRGLVKVSLDGKFDLKNIEISQDAMKLPAEELAKNIKEAHKSAFKEVTKMNEKTQKKMAKDTNIADLFAALSAKK